MTDLTHNLLVSAVMAEREREARAIARAAQASRRPQGLRAGFASRLARVALLLDREAARFWLSRDAGTHLTNGSPS